MNNRIEFIDLAKGICILEIVCGHCGLSIDIPGFQNLRMPLYFVLSGIFFKTYSGFRDFIHRKTNKILVPFLFFYILAYIAFYVAMWLVPELIRTDASGIFDVFTQRQYFNGPIWFLICLLWSIPIFVGVFFILEFFEVQQAKRVTSIVVATASLDSREVMDTDGSAAVRIKPLLNTLHLDFTRSESWFGKGCDAGLKNGLYSDDRYMGGISSYGLIGFLLSLILVFSCAIEFYSISTIMFFLGIGGDTGNIAYSWGIILVFTCLKYFQDIQFKMKF